VTSLTQHLNNEHITRCVSPELRLAALLSRPRLKPHQVDAARISATTIEPDQLYRLVIAHRIWPAVFCNVRDYFPDWLSASSFAHLKALYLANLEQNQHTFVLCGKILRDCREQTIEMRVLKGLPLAFNLYADIAKRHSNDIDLVIKERDLEAVDLILTAAGFQCPEFDRLSKKQKQIYWAGSKDITYRDKAGTMIELHVRLSIINVKAIDRYYQGLFDSTCVDKLAQLELIYLCFHGTQTLFHRLKWLTDIALYLESESPTFRRKLIEVALETGAMRALSVSWVLAGQLFDVAIPQAIAAYYHHDARCRVLVDQCLKQLSNPFAFGSLLFALKMWAYKPLIYQSNRESRDSFFSYLKPAPLDLEALPGLPQGLHFLYYLLRPALAVYRRLSHDYSR
jgi:hypothetical protein